MKRRTIYALMALLMAAFTLMPLMEATSRAAHAETTEEARTRLLGPGWDSPDVVRIKWVTITTVQPPIFTPWGTFGKPEVMPPFMDVMAVNIKHTQIRPYPGSLVGNEGYQPDVSPYMKTPPTPESGADFAMSQDDEGGNLLYV